MSSRKNANNGTDYWSMDPDGSNKRRITDFNNPNSPTFKRKMIICADSSMSPNGKMLAAYIQTNLITQNGLTVIMHLKGNEIQNATQNSLKTKIYESSRCLIVGSWQGRDGRVVTFEKIKDVYIGSYTELGGLSRYHFLRGEPGYKVKYIGNGKYEGKVKWKSTNGKFWWKKTTVTIIGDKFTDTGSDHMSRSMGRLK